MIELIFILILLELVFGLIFVHKISMFYNQVNVLNKKIKKNDITGNLSEIKYACRNLNKKLIKYEKNKQQKIMKRSINNIINTFLLVFSVFEFLRRRKDSKKAHSLNN